MTTAAYNLATAIILSQYACIIENLNTHVKEMSISKQHSTNKLINKYLFVFFSYNTGLKINQILVNYNNNKHNNSLNAFEKRGLEHRSANRRYFQYNLWKNLCENIVVV